jgi:4-amino-4-deoxy-L-arabinose transferase-like glycosyltransferase
VARLSHAHAVAAVLTVAAAARLTLLGQESYWYDEIYMVKLLRAPLSDLLSDLARGDSHPPLYPVLLWGWARLFGEAEWVIRGPSALFGTAAVAGLYLLGRNLYDRSTALLAALFLALNPFAIDYSQESRPYAMLLMFGVFASWALVRWSDAPGSWSRGVGYLVAAVCLAYSHVFGIFLLIAHGAAVLLYVPKLRLRMLAVGAGVALAFAPWLPLMLSQVDRISHDFWIGPLTFASPLEWLIVWAGYNPPLAEIGIVLVAFGSTRFVDAPVERTPFRAHRRAFLWLWIGATVGIPVVASFLMQPIFRPKYAITVIAPFALLAARALMALPILLRRGICALVVGGMLFSVVGVLYGHRTKSQYRELSELADAARRRGTLIAAEQIAEYHLDFYLEEPDSVFWIEDDADVERLARLAAERGSDVLYLLVHPPRSEREPRLEEVLLRTGETRLVKARAVRYRPR